MNAPPDFIQAMAKAELHNYRYYESIDSTNREAMHWIEQGASDYSLVFADHQTAGKGRLNRQWITNANSSLAFSLVFKLNPEEQTRLSLFSLLGALALVTTLSNKLKISSRIKWPNDVLINNQKTAGILTETYFVGGELKGLVLGIGVNIFSPSIPDNIAIRFPATCLQQHCAFPINRFHLLQDLIIEIRNLRATLLINNFVDQVKAYLAYLGEEIIITNVANNQRTQGILKGLTSKGELIMAQEGKDLIISAGEMELRPA